MRGAVALYDLLTIIGWVATVTAGTEAAVLHPSTTGQLVVSILCAFAFATLLTALVRKAGTRLTRPSPAGEPPAPHRYAITYGLMFALPVVGPFLAFWLTRGLLAVSQAAVS